MMDSLPELAAKETSAHPPKALAHEEIYKVVLDMLKGEHGLCLDFPAGEGALAQLLKSEGFEVVCADLYPEFFKAGELICTRADLSERFPFDDNSFDIAVCIEGLEHIENPAFAIREFSRVLRSKGKLIISIPNILNIEERLKVLFQGYTSHFKPITEKSLYRMSNEFPGRIEAALHINPIPYPELKYYLEKNNFEICKIAPDRKKSGAKWFYPLVGLIRLINRLHTSEYRRDRMLDELSSDEILLGGNTLLVCARKRD
jgi:SAM-dependent methyltransferase